MITELKSYNNHFEQQKYHNQFWFKMRKIDTSCMSKNDCHKRYKIDYEIVLQFRLDGFE